MAAWLARRSSLTAFILLAMLGADVSAHRLHIFAMSDGVRIDGRVYMAGGRGVEGAQIRITDDAGEVLADLESGAEGRFTYRTRALVGHRIVADSGDGHRAQWRIPAEALAGSSGAGDAREGPHAPADQSDRPSAGTRRDVVPAAPDAELRPRVLDPALSAAIEQAVARQVRPVREALAAQRNAVRAQDVIGGIGYIFGLAGLTLWWRSRRAGSSR